jgi:hypothetical protein
MSILRILLCCAFFFTLALNISAKLESAQLTELLAATTGATIVDTSDPLTVGTASLNLASLSALNDPIDTTISDEQSRINTLARSFRRLPQRELEQFYADIAAALAEHGEDIIDPDSELAKKLQVAWEQRQVELKAALNAIVKPPELMKRLISAIRVDALPSSSSPADGKGTRPNAGDASSAQDALPFSQRELDSTANNSAGESDSASRLAALQELAGLLDDVDNARDFHTMGGFAVLAQVLAPEHLGMFLDEERGLAALAIGNSVKNQYEFQLWVLDKERVATQDNVAEISEDAKDLAGSKAGAHQYSYPALLSSLLRLLETGSDQSRRSALYAVSAASRGNLDVQAALRDHLTAAEPVVDVDVSALLLLRFDDGSAELRRKIFAFISDMLEEQYYIQEQIRNPENFLIDGDASGQELELMKQLHALRPLGKSFCMAQWMHAGWQSLDATVLELVSETSAIQECLATAVAVADKPECAAKDSVDDALVAADDEQQAQDARCSPSILLSAAKRQEVAILRALLENSLSALRHMYLACPQGAQDKAEIARHSRSLRDARTWAHRVGDFSAEVDEHAAALQTGLGLD